MANKAGSKARQRSVINAAHSEALEENILQSGYARGVDTTGFAGPMPRYNSPRRAETKPQYGPSAAENLARQAEINATASRLAGDGPANLTANANAAAERVRAQGAKMMDDFALAPRLSPTAGIRSPLNKFDSFKQNGTLGTKFSNVKTIPLAKSPMSQMTARVGLQAPIEKDLTKQIISSGASMWRKANFTHAINGNLGRAAVGMGMGLGIGMLGNALAPNLATTDDHFVRNAMTVGATAGALSMIPRAVVGASVINKNIPKWAIEGSKRMTQMAEKNKAVGLAFVAAGLMGGMETHFTQAMNGNNRN